LYLLPELFGLLFVSADAYLVVVEFLDQFLLLHVGESQLLLAQSQLLVQVLVLVNELAKLVAQVLELPC
jgi:hypothetical protein